jgi:hypothetical protein
MAKGTSRSKTKRVKKVKSLPKNPVKGQRYSVITNPAKSSDGRGKNLGRREVTFRATGKKGFGKFKIESNKPA